MSENTLIKKIKNDAAQTVGTIKADGTVRVEAIQRETKELVRKMDAAYAEQIKKKQAQLELVALSKAKQASKIAIQKAKRECINELFTELHDSICGQSADEYIAFFTKYVQSIVPSDTKATAVFGPTDRSDETEKICVATGLDTNLETDPKITAGLLVYTVDGVYDITFKRILEERRIDLEMQIVTEIASNR